MKIAGLFGVVIGFIIALLLLSFVIYCFIISGGFDEENK